MDTSETYIKMCERAEEIQVLMPNDNLTATGGREYTRWLEAKGFVSWVDINKVIHFVWLPRQDQLQEMIGGDTAYLLGGFFRNLLLSLFQGLNSMEQLWLAFIMKEKYNKIWDGERWLID